jgi:tRNA 2-thiouridine synthesizing protein B
MLHTVNKSPFSSTSLDLCARFVQPGESVLLYEDAVYAAAGNTSYTPKIQELAKKVKVYALQADIKARGIAQIAEGVKVVDYAGFVDLVAEQKTNAWL